MQTGLNGITHAAEAAIRELLAAAKLAAGDILVIGCSTSEVGGKAIGSAGSTEVAGALLAGLCAPLEGTGIHLAAQCCEHLNRALVLEGDAARAQGYPPVNVVPQPGAGGAFATALWQRLQNPVAVEHISARAGLDIGGTLIGMHLCEVAVPVRLATPAIGSAALVAARTRPKFIGGARAAYNEALL